MRLDNVPECSAQMPPTHYPLGGGRGVVARGLGGGGSNLCDRMVRHQNAARSKMLLEVK